MLLLFPIKEKYTELPFKLASKEQEFPEESEIHKSYLMHITHDQIMYPFTETLVDTKVSKKINREKFQFLYKLWTMNI